VAGRIRDEDLAEVRARSPIDQVVGEYVALKSAGGGNLKGICPFHDEKSASLNVSPGKGLFHCFGCGAGGDIITFIGRIEHLSFAESVEHLAARANVQLRYVDGPSTGPRTHGQRARLIEAHAAAAVFYAQQLRTPEAAPAREFLAQRGFDEAAATRFACGYAPSGWDALTKHLLGAGFTRAELELGGLSRTSSRGTLIDRFHRRLLWPIKDISGEVVGFGARRLYDDDVVEAKYLNTPETPIYKKSSLLYGADMAKRDIAKTHQVVIVEGYTDVMACHLAGVTTAVATCGTSFGGEHVAVLRRLLMDSDTFRGAVVFTFDGDSAGMKAAERAFADDQKFMAQTFVAIEPSGMDPCELRQSAGDAAVRDLVASRIALVEFVLRATVGRFDLDTAEGRVGALDQAVPLVARIKDLGLRDEYARRLAGLVGVDDPNRIVARVRGLVRSDDRAVPGGPAGRPGQPGDPSSGAAPGRQGQRGPGQRQAPAPVDDAVVSLEREVLKIAMQQPGLAGPSLDALLPPDAFRVPEHQQVRKAIEAAGGTSSGLSGAAWVEQVGQYLPDEQLRSLARSLAVEPLHAVGADAQARYADAVFARLQEVVVAREIARLKSRLQRMNPQEEPEEHTRLFGELIRLEKLRRDLRERGVGGA
jgi:DNA primase